MQPYQRVRGRAWGRTLLCSFVLPALVLGMVHVSVRPAAAQSVEYPNITLAGYGIPTDVVQVICDNSTMTDGKSASSEISNCAMALDVSDVARMSVFSVADRVASSDGVTYDSTPNSTVSSWVKSIVKSAAEIWVSAADNPQRVLTNDEGKVRSQAVLRSDLWTDTTIAQKILADGVPRYYGASGASLSWNNPTPLFNVLMAVASSATSATTIDLTGLLSEVNLDASQYPGIRLKLLSLLQVKNQTHLKVLKLGYNNIGEDMRGCSNSDADTCTDAAESWFRTGPLAAPNLEVLSLDNNGIRVIDANLLADAANSVKRLYLSGNLLTTLNYQNSVFFQKILSNPGSVLDIAQNTELNANDSGTLHALEMAIETNGAALSIDQSVMDATLIAAMTFSDNALSAKGLISVADRVSITVLSSWFATVIKGGNDWLNGQMTADVIDAICEKNPTAIQSLSEADKDNLEAVIAKAGQDGSPYAGIKSALEKVLALANTPLESISSSGFLDFGQQNLESLYSHTSISADSQSSLPSLAGYIASGKTVTVESSEWKPRQLSAHAVSPQLQLGVVSQLGSSVTTSTVAMETNAAVEVLTADAASTASSSSSPATGGVTRFDISVNQASLSFSKVPISDMTASDYSATLTWSIVAGPGQSGE